MIRNLQAFRGIASILIFYHHYGFRSPIVESFGDFGVTFFMMLSGFVLCLAMERKHGGATADISPRRFMALRLRKIYPLYIVCWIAAILLLPYRGSRLGMVLGAAMLQSWIPERAVYFAGNPPAWFVSDLMFCYLLFVPLFNLMKRRAAAAYGIVAGYFMLYAVALWLVPGEYVHAAIYVSPLSQLSNFLIGMLGCRLYLAVKGTRPDGMASGMILSTAAIVAMQMVFYEDVPEAIACGCYWWGAALLCILSASVGEGSGGIVNRFLQSWPMLAAGRVSFSFYLIHYIGISLWHRGLGYLGIPSDTVVASVALLVILQVLSRRISYHLTN